jgi:pSer/pThr/pTyr-binding forkhead associated (FHA) protein
MNLTLLMKAGPSPGRKLVISEGQTAVIGRAASATFSFPDDKFLSGNHCVLTATAEGCKIVDPGSSNGTFVNGSRIKEANLKDGDELVVGHLTFLVQFSEAPVSPSAPATREPAASPVRSTQISASSSSPLVIGNWSFRNIPPGWELVEGHGIRDANKDTFPSSVIVGKDTLLPDVTLAQYIQAQLAIIRMHLPDARPKDVAPASFPAAEEASSLEIELPSEDGRLGVQRQLYARFGSSVGVLTFTTLASDLPRLDALFNSIRSGLSFRSE